MATDFFDPTYLEACNAALFAQLRTATFAGGLALRTAERTMTPPDEVPVANQPALYQVPGLLHAEAKNFALTRWTFVAYLWLYLRAEATQPTPAPLPATQAFYLIWGLMNVLAPPPRYDKQTLGGLVYHCWIEGEISIEVANEQVVVGIPVYMLAGNVG